jgi:hypothetical protein
MEVKLDHRLINCVEKKKVYWKSLENGAIKVGEMGITSSLIRNIEN